MSKTQKPKAKKNQVKDVKTLAQEDILWAKYGRLQAERELLSVQLDNVTQQMRKIFSQIHRGK